LVYANGFRMDFTTFLSTAGLADFWTQHRRFCFVGSSYPATFFYFLFTNFRQGNLLPASYQRLFIETIDRRTLQATLNQSVLGMNSFFWLGNATAERESKEQLEMLNMLVSYQGPHTVAFFVDADAKIVAKKNEQFIYVPEALNYQEFEQLLALFGQPLDVRKRAALKKIFTTSAPIALDTCCMMLAYLELIASKYVDEYEDLFSRLVGSLPTLSQLTEFFLAKNATAFFQVWSKVNASYPDVFWIIFWTEQLWKAYYVTQFMKDKNFVAAKRMSFRLPYSFINRDWQRVNGHELVQAYAFLYRMDYALKRGSTFCSMDLFYTNYFTGFFAAQARGVAA